MSYHTLEEIRAEQHVNPDFMASPWTERCECCGKSIALNSAEDRLPRTNITGLGLMSTCPACITAEAEYNTPQMCAGLCGETGIRGEMVKTADGSYYCVDDAILRRFVIADWNKREDAKADVRRKVRRLLAASGCTSEETESTIRRVEMLLNNGGIAAEERAA